MPLVRRFQRQFEFEFELYPEAERLLRCHRWPGNARELRNYVEYIANLRIRRVRPEDLPVGELGADEELAAAPRRAFATRDAASGASHDALSDTVFPGGGEGGKLDFILGELELAYRQGRRLGRRSLYAAARDRRLYLSEQEIRAVLGRLAAEGLVEIRSGKGGTLITEAGREALASLRRA